MRRRFASVSRGSCKGELLGTIRVAGMRRMRDPVPRESFGEGFLQCGRLEAELTPGTFDDVARRTARVGAVGTGARRQLREWDGMHLRCQAKSVCDALD